MSNGPETSWQNSSTEGEAGRQSELEKRRNLRNAIITAVLAAAIIIGGFFAPSIFYAVYGSERGVVVELADSSEDNVSQHVFDEPVSLYPWNLYDANNTSALSYSDRAFLSERGVHNFVITAMTAYGMDIQTLQPALEQPAYDYVSELLIDSFSLLHTNAEAGQSCFVIYGLDVNGDGINDIRCAVDQSGALISLLFLSEPWAAAEDTSQSTDPATDPGTTAPPADPAAEPDATTSEEDETTISPYALNLEGVEHTASGEWLSIWSYVHLIALSAAENGQTQLRDAASTLDTGFYERYVGPTTPVEGEEATEEDTEPYLPDAIVFAEVEHALYIYDLPNGMRFILYYDTDTSRCVGFNLQI